MSDQHKGLIEAVKNVMPLAEHRQFGSNYEAVENGFSECFNSVLLLVRNKPLITMLEGMRVIVMERLNTMRKRLESWPDDICPNIQKRLELAKDQQRFWHVIPVGGNNFEVRNGSEAFRVNEQDRIRTCRMGGSNASVQCGAVRGGAVRGGVVRGGAVRGGRGRGGDVRGRGGTIKGGKGRGKGTYIRGGVSKGCIVTSSRLIDEIDVDKTSIGEGIETSRAATVGCVDTV
ncbi:hypothetical protein Tco_0314073 [Tanacetum coccineum]